MLQDLEGPSTDQTAEVLGSSHAAVKSRLCRARLQLRERLNKYFSKPREFARVESGPGRDGTEELRLQGALPLILGIALLVFGPKKLPELGKGTGDGIRGFRSAMKEHAYCLESEDQKL